MPILEAVALTKIIDTGTHRVEILRGVDFVVPAGLDVAHALCVPCRDLLDTSCLFHS